MPESTHNLFLDDSGNKDYSKDGVYSATGGRTPYFVFGGLIVTPEEAGKINAWMRSLKVATFGVADVEIKAHWLRRADKRKLRYLAPYGVTDEKLTKFTDDLYAALAASACELVACVVDKHEVQEKYAKPFYPPAIAYECVLQRLQLAMIERNGYARVTIDDMEGKSPKGNEWKRNLIRQHQLLRLHGSRLHRGMALDRVLGDQPYFRDSAGDERVQLADLVAYAVYRQFVDNRAAWDDDSKPLSVYEYLGRLGPKFRHYQGQIQGFGIVKFPRGESVRWTIKKGKP